MNNKGFLCILFLAICLCGLAKPISRYNTTIIIEQVPSNTPHDASLYLASNVDGWLPDLENRQFERLADGTYQLRITHDTDTLSFKITRGNWDAVEARDNGRALPNRVHYIKHTGEVVRVSVEVWEDISIGSYTIHMFFLLIMSIQGFLLIIAINTIRNQNKRANSILSILLVLITISLLGRASTFDPDLFTWQPKLIFVPELILFTYGPIFYLYIQKLLVVEKTRNVWIHFIPAVLQIAIYIPYLLIDGQVLIYLIIDKELFPYFAISGFISLLFNGFYWWKCRELMIRYANQDHLSEKQNKYLRFLNGVLNIKAVYLTLWFAAAVIFLTGEIFETDLLYISENLIDVLWLLFSLIIFALAFYAVKHPEVLREKKKYQDNKINPNEINQVKDKLLEILNKDNLYLRPDLTLENVAHMIPTATHTLSRVINEQFDQNFTELINTYRVNAFIERIESNPKDSYLEVALAVGFNSKPTFNRAFKKIKKCTPREYFKHSKNT